MNLNKLAKEIHETAIQHGWWDTPPSFPEVIAMCHSKLSEALEEYRNGKGEIYYSGRDFYGCTEERTEPFLPDIVKPEGVAVELADCIIRILDYCGHEGIDIDKIVRIKMDYNKTRPYRHGNKKI